MKKILLCFIIFIVYYVLIINYDVKAIKLIENVEIYNYDFNDSYVVYEYKYIINNNEMHYISILDINKGTSEKILSNGGDIINDNMYFPSISEDGRYVVFTSRANNITNDVINGCFDISDNTNKNCSNIYLYDVVNKKSTMIKYDNKYLNADSYVAKISGDGNVIVFESLANNLTYDKYDCKDLNGISNCLNIYKYNILTDKISLISTGKNNYGSNSNSVFPSVSYDGRYITYQSSATNILPNYDYHKYCNNYINDKKVSCTNIFLVDSLKLKTTIITLREDELFDNNSGNSIISSDGRYVVYESYTTNNGGNGKRHIYIYDANSKTNDVLTIKDNVWNNRDNYLEDFSKDSKYVIYRSDSTNLEESNKTTNLYVVNTENKSTSSIILENKLVSVKLYKNMIVGLDAAHNLIHEKIDTISPVIEKNQKIYILKENILNIKDKISVYDNLSSREKLDIYIDNIESLKNIGEYILKVTVIDEMNNMSSEYMTINVIEKDNEGPIFNEINQIKILKGSSSLNLNNYLEAIDKVDGNTRIYIIDDGKLNFEQTGEYVIKLMSKDNSNNISYKEIKIVIYDNYNFSYFYEILLIFGIFAVIIFSIIKIK